jgi:3'-5' exoribonuclease
LKSHFVRDLQPDQVVTTSFLVQSKDVRQKKSGEPYLSLLLADCTGVLDAKMWDGAPEVMETFDRDDFVKVKGLIQIFHNRPQMTVHKLRRMEDSEADFGDYFPHTEKDVAVMWAELRRAVAEIGNHHLRALLDAILDDPEVALRFQTAPAAKSLHHACLGGLLEHVVSLVGLCRMAAQHYDFIDLDLMIAGAVLHDLGKIYELDYRRSFKYSTEGQLLGHLIIGVQMVGAKIAAMSDFPPKLKMLVEHMILSHHGQLEFGSPKVPAFPEALLLHHLDNLDSKLESMRAAVSRDRNVEGDWTAYNAALDRTVLKKERFLGLGPALTAVTAAAAVSPGEEAGPATSKPAAKSPATKAPSAFGEMLQAALKQDGGVE